MKAGRGHGQPGRTETALETLCVDQRLLHGMQFPIAGQPLDRRHLPARSAKGRHQAAMDGNTIEPDCASSAIAGIASLLDSEPSQVAEEGAQALPGPWLRGKGLAVDVIVHEPILGREFTADLLGEIEGHMFAVSRGPVNVIKVQCIRDHFAKLASKLIGSGDQGKLDPNGSHVSRR